MILYTMMPQELIFASAEETYGQEQQIISHNGVPILVESVGQQYQVVRVLSTDPAHFMDNRWMPGAKISPGIL